MSSSVESKQVVLAGAGHAHLHVAKNAGRFAAAGAALTLINEGVFWYSGLATGMLGGMYEPRQDQIDPQRLIESNGGRFIRDRVTGVDTANRQVRLASGEVLHYDVVSFNVGSRTITRGVDGAAEHGWTVKPISNLDRLRNRIEQRATDGGAEPLRAVVIGGGPTGCEVAANLVSLGRRRSIDINVKLLNRGERVLRSHPAGASRTLTKALRQRGVEVCCGAAASQVHEDAVITAGGERLPCDLAVIATGLEASPLMGDMGLPVDDEGGLLIDARLRSMGDERVFAAGDCASMVGRKLPKVGVFGVRQAPVLLDNLLATLRDSPQREYEPQKKFLIILNLGDGEGLAIRGRWWWRGRLSLQLKDRLDQKFLDRYR